MLIGPVESMPLPGFNRLHAWNYTCPMIDSRVSHYLLVYLRATNLVWLMMHWRRTQRGSCAVNKMKSWWCSANGRGFWTLPRLRHTCSSTNMSWRVIGQCPQLRNVSGVSFTCTMSWGTFTLMVSPEVTVWWVRFSLIRDRLSNRWDSLGFVLRFLPSGGWKVFFPLLVHH